jgi:hypothetical protein
MPFPLSEWWFWVFVAPEAVVFVGWLVFLVVAALGYGASAAYDAAQRKSDTKH